jgi:predicted GNAT family acetyltransferase
VTHTIEPTDFDVVNDEKSGIYKAIAVTTEIAGMPYNVAGHDRIVLLATSVIPEFRNQGVATRLIRTVLDDLRAHGKTVTVVCPIVRHFIARNPEYADLVDPEHPGRPEAPHRA